MILYVCALFKQNNACSQRRQSGMRRQAATAARGARSSSGELGRRGGGAGGEQGRYFSYPLAHGHRYLRGVALFHHQQDCETAGVSYAQCKT
jgi:hypothetical protein